MDRCIPDDDAVFEKLSDDHLGALSRALYEARFPAEENEPTVWVSPLVITLHCAVIEEQRSRLRAAGRSERSLDRWLAWEHQAVPQAVAVRRFAEDEHLRQNLVTGGAELLRESLRPFVLTDDDVLQLLDRIHAATGALGT